VGHGLGKDQQAVRERGFADVAGGLVEGEGIGAELVGEDCGH